MLFLRPQTSKPVRQAMCPVMTRTTLIVPWASTIRRSFHYHPQLHHFDHVLRPRGGRPHEGHATRSCTQCATGLCLHSRHVVRNENFFFLAKDVVRGLRREPPPPPCSSKGFEAYIKSVRGATGNRGQELTRGCCALRQSPPPPCFEISFTPTELLQNDHRDEAVILSQICWGPGPPPPP